MTKEDIKAIFKAGEALGFAKRAGQPTIGLTFDEQYEQLVKNCSIPDVSGTTLLVHGTDGRVYNPSSIKEWESSGNVEKGDIIYKADIIKKY